MVILYSVVALLGLIFGSFAGAQVWRLRARQLVQDKAQKEPYDAHELKRLLPLTKTALKDDRSQCLNCHHELQWYDLLPLVSWLSTAGKCRYCKEPIGRFEPLIEIGTAVLFVSFVYYWLAYQGLATITDGILLIVWLAALVMMVILFVYDAKWFLLPNVVMFPLIGLSLAISIVAIFTSPDPLDKLLSTVGAVAILSGLYLFLWTLSKGTWVGFGDVKLGLALGLLLGNWELAFLTLFLANVFGLIMVLPGLITKKIGRGSQIPFGPMLMLGFIVSLYFGQAMIAYYMQLSNLFVDYTLML